MLHRVAAHLRPAPTGGAAGGGGGAAPSLYPAATTPATPRGRPKLTYHVTVHVDGRDDQQQEGRRVMVQPRESVDYLKARLTAQLALPEGRCQRLALASAPDAELLSRTEGGPESSLADLGVAEHCQLNVSLREPPATPAPPLPPGASATTPRVVRTAAEANACVKREGICIFELASVSDALAAPAGEWRHRAANLGAEVFGSALAMAKTPVGVDDPSRVLKPHNDGANPYGCV